MHVLYADTVASITELKKNPMEVINNAEGNPIAILNRNEPVFYCVPYRLFESLMEMVEDLELAAIVKARENEEAVPVNIDDLLTKI
jgi:antitoxin StbD